MFRLTPNHFDLTSLLLRVAADGIISIKQRSWGTHRVYYAPVLARGKLHTVLLGDDFPGEKPEGAAKLVAKVRASLNIRFQSDDQPDIVFTDRGQGFYRLTGA